MKKTVSISSEVEIVETLSFEELCRFCHAGPSWIGGLVEHGVIEPVDLQMTQWHFEAASVARARKARRLAQDLGINMPGIALALDLIDHRDALLRRLAQISDTEVGG